MESSTSEPKEIECTEGFLPKETKFITPTNTSETTIGIRPRPLICKPGRVNISDCKSEPIETKRPWAPGAWQDATRTSAFQPYKPPTLLTNLQRGNTKTEIPLVYNSGDIITFYTLAGQGELTADNIDSAKVNVPDANGLTALMWAAAYGQLNTVKLLVKFGADVNWEGSCGETSLHFAAAAGHHDIVKFLLNCGADIDAVDKDGNTSLLYGAQGDHPHVCHELLSKGADLTISNYDEVSPYAAALKKDAATAKAVIENYLIQKIVQIPSDLL